MSKPVFNRPSINLSKRVWKRVPWNTLKPGDIVADHGIVHNSYRPTIRPFKYLLVGIPPHFVEKYELDMVMAFVEGE